jgi:flagellar protein FliS
MTTAALARNRYLRDSVSTASPQRLVVMLYDGLVQDLQLAQQGVAQGDIGLVHTRLVRAQAIVTELQTSLDLDAWDGAKDLDRLYTYVLELLVDANVRKDAAPLVQAMDVVEPLRDAWHQALAATGS